MSKLSPHNPREVVKKTQIFYSQVDRMGLTPPLTNFFGCVKKKTDLFGSKTLFSGSKFSHLLTVRAEEADGKISRFFLTTPPRTHLIQLCQHFISPRSMEGSYHMQDTSGQMFI